MVKLGGGDRNNLHVGNNTFEEVKELNYLGNTLIAKTTYMEI